MPSAFTEYFFFPLFSAFIAILVYVWKILNDRVKSLEAQVCALPVNNIKEDIAEIKNDLKWIKQSITKN